MNDFIVTSLSSAYAVVGLLGLIAYLPTAFDLFQQRIGINLWTYAFWFLASLVASLYFWLVVGDKNMPIIYGLHVLACGLIIYLHLQNLNRSVSSRQVAPFK